MSRQAADDLTNEALVLEIRTTPEAAWALLVDPGPWTRLLAFSYWAPWRAMAIGGIGVSVGLAVRSDLILAASVIGAFVLGVSEVLHRRDFVTVRRIVRQSGLFGRRRRVFPVVDVEDVRVSYRDDARRFRGGDVEICGQGWGVTFQCVANPESVAEAIVCARDAARTVGRA